MFYLFIYTFLLALTLPLFFPYFHVLFFAPFIIYSFYRSSLSICLWWSLACGVIVDLFSADTKLGHTALNYCLVTFFLYRYQFHLFEDRLSTLPVMTFCFTAFSTIIQITIFYIMGRTFSLSWQWGFNDLLFMPLQGAIYSILAFTLPLFILNFWRRRLALNRLSKRK